MTHIQNVLRNIKLENFIMQEFLVKLCVVWALGTKIKLWKPIWTLYHQWTYGVFFCCCFSTKEKIVIHTIWIFLLNFLNLNPTWGSMFIILQFCSVTALPNENFSQNKAKYAALMFSKKLCPDLGCKNVEFMTSWVDVNALDMTWVVREKDDVDFRNVPL